MPVVNANGKRFTFPDGTTPDQMGEAIDEYFGVQKKEPEPPGFMQRANMAINEGMGNFMKSLAGAHDAGPDIAHIPNIKGRPVTHQLISEVGNAATLKGKLNIIRKRFPNASLEMDDQGRPGFRPNEKSGVKIRNFKPRVDQHGRVLGLDPVEVDAPDDQFILFDSPNVTAGDLGDPQRFIGNNAAALAASLGTGKLGFLKSVATVGAGGAVDEFGRQARSEAAGAREGFSLERIVKHAAITGAGEGVARVAAAVASRIARLVGKPVESVVKDGKITEEAQKALMKEGLDEDDIAQMTAQSLKRQKGLTKQESQRIEDFKTLKAKPTKAEVTRKHEDFQFEEETQKLSFAGKPIRERRAETSGVLAKNLETLRKKTGGTATDPSDIGNAVKTTTRVKKKEVQEVVSKLYDDMLKKHGDTRVVPSMMMKTLQDLKRFENLSPEIKTFRSGLSSFMKIKKVDGKNKIVGVKPVKVSEMLIKREELNQLVGLDLKTNARIRRVINSIDNDVLGQVGGEFKVPIEAAKKKLDEFEPNVRLAEKHGEDATNIVQRIFEGKLDDSDVMNVIINKSGKEKDLIAIKKTFHTGTKQQVKRGRQAWNEMRGGTLTHLANKAISPGEQNTVIFSGAKFASELDKIGAKKLSILFTKEELKMIGVIRRVGEARIPVPGTVNTSNTSSALINYLGRGPVIDQIKGAIRIIKTSKAMDGEKILKTRNKVVTKEGKKAIRQFMNRLNPAAVAGASAVGSELSD